MLRFIDETPLIYFVLAALLLGLAPFVPAPHIVEKWRMLMAGELYRPVDLFDVLVHGTPWILLAAKLLRLNKGQKK